MEELRKSILAEMKALTDTFTNEIEDIDKKQSVDPAKITNAVVTQYANSVNTINTKLADFEMRQKQKKKSGWF